MEGCSDIDPAALKVAGLLTAAAAAWPSAPGPSPPVAVTRPSRAGVRWAVPDSGSPGADTRTSAAYVPRHARERGRGHGNPAPPPPVVAVAPFRRCRQRSRQRSPRETRPADGHMHRRPVRSLPGHVHGGRRGRGMAGVRSGPLAFSGDEGTRARGGRPCHRDRPARGRAGAGSVTISAGGQQAVVPVTWVGLPGLGL